MHPCFVASIDRKKVPLILSDQRRRLGGRLSRGSLFESGGVGWYHGNVRVFSNADLFPECAASKVFGLGTQVHVDHALEPTEPPCVPRRGEEADRQNEKQIVDGEPAARSEHARTAHTQPNTYMNLHGGNGQEKNSDNCV